MTGALLPPPFVIRPFDAADAEARNAVALEAFVQYREVYADWEGLAASVGRMAALAGVGEIIVAEREGGVGDGPGGASRTARDGSATA